MLGRRGKNRPNLLLADFRHQQGIYILYGNLGPYYVGLTRRQGLGKRLKDHLNDQHHGKWDRFSWFGFCGHLKPEKATGLCPIKQLPKMSLGSADQVIADLEALLIKSMGLRNVIGMKFQNADEWTQVGAHEVDLYTRKVVP